jgi:hypothetical protein
MKDSKKKIVAFDTSFLIEVEKKNIDIDKKYPNDEYIRCAQDTVADELFLDKQNQWMNCSERSYFFKQNNISFLESFDAMILQEYVRGKDNFSIIRISDATECFSFLEGQHPEQLQKEIMYLNYVDQRSQAKQNDFDAIPYTESTAVNINVPNLQKDIVNCINSEDGYLLPIVTKPTLVFPDPTDIKIRNGKMLLNIKYAINRCRYKNPKFFQNLEEEFPTIYNLLVYDQFIKNLKRPEHTKTHRKNKFNLILETKEDEKLNIRIGDDVSPDFRISLAGLAYIDAFATCDKSQALLIKGLYPSYYCKVSYYKDDVTSTKALDSENNDRYLPYKDL